MSDEDAYEPDDEQKLGNILTRTLADDQLDILKVDMLTF